MAIIKFKRGTAANLSSVATTAAAGEPIFTTDSGKLYIHNGTELKQINPDIGLAATNANGLMSSVDKVKLDGLNKGTSAGNLPILGADGKLSESVLPSIAITDTFVVANQGEMLAVSAQVGDVVIRTDSNKSYILQKSPSATLANWIELKSPTAAVSSVAGRTGDVVIAKSDVGLGNVANESKATMFTNAALTGVSTAPTAANGTKTNQIATCNFVLSQGYINNSSIIDGGTF
ncbi:MAG: hypothetical protein RR806_06370 [Oscillospiraceae bacterium]